jgi:hypothetical protein
MNYDIEIELGARRIGSATIVKNPQQLHGTRTASGFEIQVPITLTLRARPKNEPMLMVSNLRGKVFVKDDKGSPLNVGYLTNDERHIAGITSGESYDHSSDIRLDWRGTFADIAYIEKARNGQAPKFQMWLEGEWSFLIRNEVEISQDQWNRLTEPERRRFNELASFRIATDSQRLVSRHGYVEVPYPREVWIDLVRKLGTAENVLVEVPLPTSPPDPWTGVWSALINARNAFEQGGSSGWHGTVTSVRLALERWRDIEAENQGPGWNAPSVSDRQLRSKKERLDALRWHLMQAAHLGPHTDAADWSRDDALLMLSTLSGLLAVRKP